LNQTQKTSARNPRRPDIVLGPQITQLPNFTITKFSRFPNDPIPAL
jgi:hypothetical protein